MYKKFFKILISNLLFLLITFNQNAISKPIPPGSGEGDVPANILILLDSSASMKRKIIAGDGIENPTDIIELTDGNIIIGEGNFGFVKINTTDKTVDTSFADNNRNFRGSATDTCTLDGTNNSIVRSLNDLGLATNVLGVTGDVIYGADSNSTNGKIVGINTSGECIEVITHAELGNFRPRAMEIRTIGGQDHLFASGKWWDGGWRSRFYTKNLSTGHFSTCGGDKGGNLKSAIKMSTDLTVDNSGNYIYWIWRGSIWGFALTKEDNNYCPSDEGRDRKYIYGNGSSKHRKASGIDISRDGTSTDNIMYVVSHYKNKIQKIQLLTDTTVVSLAEAGKRQRSNNTADAGALAADSVNFWKPGTLYVSSTKVWVTDKKATIQEFNENIFESSTDTSWQKEYGGAKLTRYEGAKRAIVAIVSDTSLTSGANFGYGHWNSGESGGRKFSPKGGKECHYNLDDCDYYQGWDTSKVAAIDGVVAEHPEGTSSLCNSDSCLLVGVGPEGYTEIPTAIETFGLAWGTDANAFSQMAFEYYTDNDVGIIDENLTCQLSYVIVIGDGAWRHHNQAAAQIKQLRTVHGVKTIVVAYGGGITGGAMDNFDNMALAGSCDDPSGKAKPCEATIVANTPGQLKTQLQSKIQQIIADRLSFTAPSITATIQEGGDLYQAQFNYEQHGEWQGTILRKAIKPDGSVEHAPGFEGNWDAAELLKDRGSTDRKIWTALSGEGASYVGNWNNWTTVNKSDIEDLFEITENTLTDYHHTSSNCSGSSGVADGTDDDLEGLINFVRGVDYFDYNGNCNIAEDRSHLLGDIYHSQLVEVGPPSANTDFINMNQEAYWRSANNYQSFARTHDQRKRIIYAGANDGMLHAFDAVTGQEEWGFIPPFIAAKLPVIVNKEYDGKINVSSGGTNPIFAVDGSPVIHDMFIKGLIQDGTTVSWEETPSWHTILMIPFGRGGAGFSVLDITYPMLKEGKGPLHMYSIFNDAINNKVLVADHEGIIAEHAYDRGAIHIRKSEEALIATKNQNNAEDLDPDDCEDTDPTSCTEQDAIYTCQTNADFVSNKFRIDGINACFKGTKFTFNLEVPSDASDNVNQSALNITEEVDGTLKPIYFKSAKMVSGLLEIEFNSEKIFNASGSDKSTEANNSITIQTSCEGKGTDDGMYDYSQLGETWSTPRIFRIPKDSNIANDTYVAVMGGGMGNTFICSGSNVFLVNLEGSGEGDENPGSLYGYKENDGPITIIDTDPAGYLPGLDDYLPTPNGSNIANAIPASPVVITPDLAKGIPWRGAMVYINDLEGKITKINLTNQKEVNLYAQTTLFTLRANKINSRYNYHSMDAAIGKDTNNFWLFGGTGNYNRIGSAEPWMDNILYGVKDKDYPYFKHLNGVEVPEETNKDFLKKAHDGAEKANHVDDSNICVDTTYDTYGTLCPKATDQGWVIHLDARDGKAVGESVNRYRKVSATPTVYKGNVYFPVYQPPEGVNRCNLGKAYICTADDECGTNNSSELSSIPTGDDCYFVRRGILSELVIFGDTLFANVAGPSDTEETLVSILGTAGDISTYRKSWRENY